MPQGQGISLNWIDQLNINKIEFKSPGNYGSYEVTQDFQKIVLDENNNSDKNIVDSL